MDDPKRYDKSYANKSLALFSAFIIVVMYIDTMLVPSLPSIAAQYGINAAQVSLILSMYLVSGVALNPIVGKLGDIYGKKRVLKYVLPIYTAAVAVTGFSPNFAFLIISRVVQGVGLTILPLALSLVREQFPPEQMPKAQGLLSAMFGVGAAIGLPVGAFISNNYGWQVTYHTALPLVAILSLMIIMWIRESEYMRPSVRIDYFGAACLALGLGSLVFALSEGSYFGWSSTLILALIATCVLSFAAVIGLERRTSEPILDFKLLRSRNVFGSNLIVFIVGFGFFLAYQTYAYQFELPPPIGFGYDIFHTGLALVPFAVMNIVAAPLVSRYLTRYGTKPFLYIGATMSAIGFYLSSVSGSAMQYILSAAIVGAGTATLNVSLINVLILSVDRKDIGLATSTSTVFRTLGSSLGAPFAGLLIAELTGKLPFTYSFYTAIASFLAVMVVAVYVHEVLGEHRVHHEPVTPKLG